MTSGKLDNTAADFKVGQRIQVHPAHDLFMRGARYGNVIGFTRDWVRVQLDMLPKPVRIAPRYLLDVED